MSERPKTHLERAEGATRMVNSLMDALSSDRLNAEAADIVARETYPDELVGAATKVLNPHHTPQTVDEAMAALRAALGLYEDKP